MLLRIWPKYSRTLTEKSTPFSETCQKFTVIFLKIVIIFLGRNTPNNRFLNVTNKETEEGRPLVLALFASINNNQPASSILIGDFNAICSKLCRSSKNNIAGLETDNITTTAGYSQVINKRTQFINRIFSCLDLIFSSNMSFIRNYGNKQFIFNDYHHNIIYGTLDFNIP